MKENVPVLADIVNLRRQMAKLLGYESWAAYRLEDKMAKNTKTVNDVSCPVQMVFIVLIYLLSVLGRYSAEAGYSREEGAGCSSCEQENTERETRYSI